MKERASFTFDKETIEIIDKLEKDLRVPVVTCVQAAIWNCMRLLDIREPIDGFGRLLENI